jgi:hypothetical protein|tara:strand:- start:287 stop:487 length:201 start_codon:yes stop_codon:yes gene_type:complete
MLKEESPRSEIVEVGDLVRVGYKIGIVVAHTMWDQEYGAYRVRHGDTTELYRADSTVCLISKASRP